MASIKAYLSSAADDVHDERSGVAGPVLFFALLTLLVLAGLSGLVSRVAELLGNLLG
jgi:hypothetical protein